MSRNFEMLQQVEQSRTLFRNAVELPPLPTSQVVSEHAEPEEQQIETQLRDERVRQGPSSHGRPVAVATVFQDVELFPWMSWLRTGVNWLGIRSNGQTHNSRGLVDYKNMALQEEIKLIERVFLGPDSGSNKVILFSGVDKAEGGARVCARAAERLATHVHGSVCVVDADLHSRSLQHHLQVRDTPGLSEAALQSAPIRRYAQQLAFRNFWVITCGGEGAHSQVPLNSERMRIRFEELRRQFDYILINAPSMGMVANLTQFARLADGVIFVVEANSTRRETTKRFKESVEEVHARVLGVVLNDRTFPIPEAVYRKL